MPIAQPVSSSGHPGDGDAVLVVLEEEVEHVLWRRRRRRPRDLRHAPLVRVELDGVDNTRDAEEVGDTQ